jgi:MFS family permease
MICNACLQPLTGKVYTYFSLRYAFLSFVMVFELGSLICAVSQSSTMLVVGRAVAGMGGSGIQNGALTMIAVAAPPSQRPTLMGIVMAMAGAGQLIAPLIGGALTQHASWRWCFYVLSAPPLHVTLSNRYLAEPARRRHRPSCHGVHTDAHIQKSQSKLDLSRCDP